MSTCITCGTEAPASGRFCSSCGAPLRNSDEFATLDFAPPTPPRSPKPPSASSGAMNEGLFLPGSLLAGRYRIIALLGRGGMGEVYRADDLTLGQPVALKFLPDAAAHDEALLERFRAEVRIARRVSHPNVCRVYDVGEVEGHTFFTMEYVDGEDLASLLRRIGRLPQDKALDVARQLCAGLAAAHAKGVLHRDMKPANIMLDGRGQVVVTDFGLAGIADQIHGAEVRSGTPAYMSPEQLAGKEVTTRSDIYALGLVLYEVFTGKRPFAEESGHTKRRDPESVPSRPSILVKDLDPAIERAILRCLELEPSARPANVLSVAAALPGGDPLAAALAAGETPSPQMVAAAGNSEGLRPRTAIACLSAILAGLALMVVLAIHNSGLEKMNLELSPEVLTQRAREIVTRLGYDKRPADSAWGLYNNGDMIASIEKTDQPRPDWDRILAGGRPAPIQYWYRQSPRPMVPNDIHDILLTPGIIGQSDPPETTSNMVRVELDPQGHLIYLVGVPPETEEPASQPSPPPDWNAVFALAGLDPAQLKPAQPIWNSLGGADSRMAWTGMWPGTERPMRVEAASWRGRPVFFSVLGDWTKPQRAAADPLTRGQKLRIVGVILLFLCIVAGAAILARRNWLLGRGDRQGALRLASVMFVLQMALWLCRSHFSASFGTFSLLFRAISSALLVAGITWLLYLALEPWVRRRWPQSIISWSRVLSGQLRDALVGRDLMFGVMLGLAWSLIFQIHDIPLRHAGAAPDLYSADFLMGGRHALGIWLMRVPSAILGALEFFYLLLLLKVLLRKEWIAAIAFVAIFAGLNSAGSHSAIEVPTVALVYLIAVVIVYRFGLVSLTAAIFTVEVLANTPFSADFSAWYMTTSILLLLSVLAIAGWGFYLALGGRPLWKENTG